MDKSIYEDRARDLDEAIQPLLPYMTRDLTLDEDQNKLRSQAIRDFAKLAEVEQQNARILLAIKEQEVASRAQDLEEQVSLEKHEIDQKAAEAKAQELEIKAQELEIKVKELELKQTELDVKLLEADRADRELAQKESTDKEKLAVEKFAVIGRLGSSGLQLAEALGSGILMILGIALVMRFEKDDDGGILPTKILSQVFRIVKK